MKVYIQVRLENNNFSQELNIVIYKENKILNSKIKKTPTLFFPETI